MIDAKTSTTAEPAMRELSIEEIDATAGAGILGDIGRFLKKIFSGDGDQRRPLDRPARPPGTLPQ